eukprot:COSAG02_NODE_559_length_20335_cov_10.631894_13_plen_204_part_00
MNLDLYLYIYINIVAGWTYSCRRHGCLVLGHRGLPRTGEPRRLHCSQTAFVISAAAAVLAAMASKSNSASTLVTPGIRGLCPVSVGRSHEAVGIEARCALCPVSKLERRRRGGCSETCAGPSWAEATDAQDALHDGEIAFPMKLRNCIPKCAIGSKRNWTAALQPPIIMPYIAHATIWASGMYMTCPRRTFALRHPHHFLGRV